jgi:hypothetical protein
MSSILDILKASTPKYELTLPSNGEIKKFRPFLVKEEKILLIAKQSSDEMEVIHAVQELIESCVEGIEDIINLPMFDIEYMYLKLRAKSIGETVTPKFTCPKTKETIQTKININDIEVIRTKNHTNKIKISDDLIIYMKYPSIDVMENLNRQNKKENQVPLYNLIVNTIDTIETKEETVDGDIISAAEMGEFVGNLTKEQYEKIIKFYTTSPKLEYEVKYKTKDGENRTFKLQGLLSFFK